MKLRKKQVPSLKVKGFTLNKPSEVIVRERHFQMLTTLATKNKCVKIFLKLDPKNKDNF